MRCDFTREGQQRCGTPRQAPSTGKLLTQDSSLLAHAQEWKQEKKGRGSQDDLACCPHEKIRRLKFPTHTVIH